MTQVAMRASAREIGLMAIQSAAVERSLEEDLAAERKALLAALTAAGSKSVRDVAAGNGRPVCLLPLQTQQAVT